MLRIALGVSLLLHTALGVWVEVRGAARDETKVVVDSWQGPGIEVDAVTTESRAALSGAGVAVAPAPTPASEPTPLPAPAAAPQMARADTDGVSAPRPRAVRPARSAPTPPREGSPTNLPKPAATSAPSEGATATASGTTSYGSASAANGAFGAAGLPAGVRHLPKAFTRALGLASRGDPRWLTQSPGPVGEARIRLTVDEDGRLGELEYVTEDERARLAPVLVHLLENTRLLLVAGRFSLDPTRTQAGAQTLRVRVELTERTTDVDPDADPNGLNELEYEAPSGRKPGRGSFRLNSGRRVIGWVYVE